MKPITTITSPAVPLLRDNIDTDTIIPSREMRSTGRTGLADGLFAPWRYSDADARLPEPGFVLNHRDAIGTRLFGQIGAVIQDEGHVSRIAHRQQRLAGAQHVGIAHILQPKLERRHRAAIERGLQAFGEGGDFDARRRDDIKLAGRPLILFEAVGKVGRQGNQFVVRAAQGQALPR